MIQKSPHTWERMLSYQRCPSCGYIMESRAAFENRLGKYQQDLQCGRCSTSFTVSRRRKVQAGPFFGEAPSPEVTWETND